jgi:hypothetical protein
MEKLYLMFYTVYSEEPNAASGLQEIFKKDVSSRLGCINRILPSTLRFIGSQDSGAST